LGKAKRDRISKIAREANLVLANREARVSAPSAPEFKPKIQWAALRAAHEMSSENSNCFIAAQIYNEARTYFEQN